MQTAQIMADYSMGKADMLRRAMGKKKAREMAEHRKIFIDGAMAKGVDKDKANDIFEIMAKFASYGFNRSHAAAYSVLAFQTAYLKTHYPAEYMASVLTHNKNDISKLNFFLRECKRMGIPVLGPDINESQHNFTVNAEGKIRFGLTAIKGVGEGPVDEILIQRESEGGFLNCWEMMRRLNLRTVNKKCMESLVLGGAMDRFTELDRSQYFAPSLKHDSFITHLLKYGNAYVRAKDDQQNSLFQNSSDVSIPEPSPPQIEPWSLLEKLTKEKEVTGIYISGHPLDDYEMEVKHFTNTSLDNIEAFKDKVVRIAGIISEVQHRISRKGTGYGKFVLQDYNGSLSIQLFKENYQKFKHLMEVGSVVFMKGSYEKGFSGEEYFLRVKELKQLEGVTDDFVRSITIKLPIELIEPEMIDSIETLCTERPGNHKLKICIIDESERMVLSTVSRSFSVNADNDFIQKLGKMNLEYNFN